MARVEVIVRGQRPLQPARGQNVFAKPICEEGGDKPSQGWAIIRLTPV
jgi:hypothetical protein